MSRGNKFYRLTFDTTKKNPPAYLTIRNIYLQLPEYYLLGTLRIFFRWINYEQDKRTMSPLCGITSTLAFIH